MERTPIITGVATDFSGALYNVEALPPAQQCNEGDTCMLAQPGGSAWYQYWYRVENGRWVLSDTTEPWQLST